jgi:hypothetical protein
MDSAFGSVHGNRGDNRRKMIAIKDIDFVDITPTSEVLFKPFNGKSFIVTRVTVVTRTRTGTITTEPTAKLTDGTNDIVATVALTNTNQGRAKTLTIVTDRPVTYAAPLTLTKVVAAAGTNPVVRGDMYIEGILI